MRKLLPAVLSLGLIVPAAYAADGMIDVKSPHSVKKTVTKLEAALKAKGMTQFAKIDHADGAKKVGLKLRPTVLVIFGNPKAGTPFMQCGQSAAIDFPQKALIWQDESGQVWYSYNDPQYIATRHGIKECGDAVQKISNALGNFAKAATKP